MKYLILVPDGMADRPCPSLGGRTPMEAAHKPRMDKLASRALCGTVSNVPTGMVPESDTANLSILSYDPRIYSKGRSPLEAMSLGLEMSPRDTALRCNFVTLSGTAKDCYEDRTILDHSSGDTVYKHFFPGYFFFVFLEQGDRVYKCCPLDFFYPVQEIGVFDDIKR